MNVRVNQNYQLVGSALQMDKHKVYDAVKATNQPNYEEEGLVFVSPLVEVGEIWHPYTNGTEILLNKNEYEIVVEMKCPSCKKRGIIRPDNDYDITEYDTHINYAFYCGHFRNVKRGN